MRGLWDAGAWAISQHQPKRVERVAAREAEGEGIEGGTDCIGWERGLQRVGERFVGAGGVDCESWVCNARDLRELCMARRHGIA
jgi:hypothetical protein